MYDFYSPKCEEWCLRKTVEQDGKWSFEGLNKDQSLDDPFYDPETNKLEPENWVCMLGNACIGGDHHTPPNESTEDSSFEEDGGESVIMADESEDEPECQPGHNDAGQRPLTWEELTARAIARGEKVLTGHYRSINDKELTCHSRSIQRPSPSLVPHTPCQTLRDRSPVKPP
jgi:hypothetical protein